MEKPNKVNEDTYQAFVKAMRNVVGIPTYTPSRNYLKREIDNPTKHVGCSVCNARSVTLYKDKSTDELFCKNHKRKN